MMTKRLRRKMYDRLECCTFSARGIYFTTLGLSDNCPDPWRLAWADGSPIGTLQIARAARTSLPVAENAMLELHAVGLVAWVDGYIELPPLVPRRRKQRPSWDDSDLFFGRN